MASLQLQSLANSGANLSLPSTVDSLTLSALAATIKKTGAHLTITSAGGLNSLSASALASTLGNQITFVF